MKLYSCMNMIAYVKSGMSYNEGLNVLQMIMNVWTCYLR